MIAFGWCPRRKDKPYSSSVHQPCCPARTEKDEIIEMIKQEKDIEVLKQISDDILSLKLKMEQNENKKLIS